MLSSQIRKSEVFFSRNLHPQPFLYPASSSFCPQIIVTFRGTFLINYFNDELICTYGLLQISYDIVQDILEQGDCLSDTLKGLQDAVSLTKVLHQLRLSLIVLDFLYVTLTEKGRRKIEASLFFSLKELEFSGKLERVQT